MRWSRVIRFSAVSTLALLMGACGGAEEEGVSLASALPNIVVVTATDFAFDAPAEIPAGPTMFRMVNEGAELHHVTLVRLDPGKTVEDLLALQPSEPYPDWAQFVGGPNAVAPGDVANSTQTLEPGHYALLCFVFGPDGVPHIAKGMVAEMDVVETEVIAGAEPPADLVVKMLDYGFKLPEPVGAGLHVIRVENEGPQPHELALVKLAPGKTLEDFVAWVETGTGEPAGELLGGVSPLDAGKHALFTARLTPGDYALLCFVPDEKTGKLHVEHGMVKLFTVS